MNTAPDRIATYRALLGFMAVALILHLPVLGLSFLSDDLTVLHRIGEQNDLGTGSFFRPLPDWTHWLTYRIVGPTPWVFRVVNVLLLGFNAWLVMLLARRMAERTLLPEGPVWAVLAGLFYVIYPFHLEPQVWIVGRSTAMASSFVLLATWTALGTAPVRQRSAQVALWTFLGALCYEYALLIPGMLIIVWLVLEPRHPREWLPMIISASLVVGLNLALRSWASGAVANTYGSALFPTRWWGLHRRRVEGGRSPLPSTRTRCSGPGAAHGAAGCPVDRPGLSLVATIAQRPRPRAPAGRFAADDRAGLRHRRGGRCEHTNQ